MTERERWIARLDKELKRRGFGGLARIEIRQIARDAMAFADASTIAEVKRIRNQVESLSDFGKGGMAACDDMLNYLTPPAGSEDGR